jgi:RNA polymerase sigma-70 factor (ECF subfamily)
MEVDFGARLVEQLPALRRYATKLARNAADAEDLVQDTVLRAWSRQHLWDPRLGQLRQWLATICFHQFIGDQRRARKSYGTALDDAAERSVAAAQTDVIGVHEVADRLGSLSAEQRRLILHAATGSTYREIAAMTRLPLGTVASGLWRARQVLNDAMRRRPRLPADRRNIGHAEPSIRT